MVILQSVQGLIHILKHFWHSGTLAPRTHFATIRKMWHWRDQLTHLKLSRARLCLSALQVPSHSPVLKLHFLKIFPSIAICPLLRMISWNLAIRLNVLNTRNVAQSRFLRGLVLSNAQHDWERGWANHGPLATSGPPPTRFRLPTHDCFLK